jgi:hypothetical protein
MKKIIILNLILMLSLGILETKDLYITKYIKYNLNEQKLMQKNYKSKKILWSALVYKNNNLWKIANVFEDGTNENYFIQKEFKNERKKFK